MRLQIDTKEKRIYLIDDININELRKFMKVTFPDDYNKYVISSHNMWTYYPYVTTYTNTDANHTFTTNSSNLSHIPIYDVKIDEKEKKDEE